LPRLKEVHRVEPETEFDGLNELDALRLVEYLSWTN
jgi:hypothetical protein